VSPEIHQMWNAINAAERSWQHNDLPWPEWRDHFVWVEATDLTPVTDRQVFRSFTTLEPGQLGSPAGFVIVDAWSDPPYRMVWSAYEQHVILTYVEGDLSYVTTATPEAASLARRETWAFYRDLSR
jgi:hypothetical protein